MLFGNLGRSIPGVLYPAALLLAVRPHRWGRASLPFTGSPTDPWFSPDGSRIVYIMSDGHIYTAKTDGSGVKQLMMIADQYYRPVWGVVY